MKVVIGVRGGNGGDGGERRRAQGGERARRGRLARPRLPAAPPFPRPPFAGGSYKAALADGWVPGVNLLSVEEAAKAGTVVMFLLSDAGQKAAWPALRALLAAPAAAGAAASAPKTLYFSHGFSVVFHKDTGVVPPPGIDVVLVAPKGSGLTLRTLFLEGKGLNSSVAVWQDASGKAEERAYALAVAVGSGYMYPTTFEKEVFSDLTGERGILMGAIQGLFKAQYDVLRAKGHSPSEAFNETVEEATQSLYPLIGKNGMDWMYANCSTTAQRGALECVPRARARARARPWRAQQPRYPRTPLARPLPRARSWWGKFYDATKPVFERLYAEVANGNEARRTLEKNSQRDYRPELEKELEAMRNSEMWRAGVTVRSLRPENMPKK